MLVRAAKIVNNLAHLWMAAERLLGRPCDPLDEKLIALMERGLISYAPNQADNWRRAAV